MPDLSQQVLWEVELLLDSLLIRVDILSGEAVRAETGGRCV